MPKPAGKSALWKRFEDACADLKPAKSSDQATIQSKLNVSQSTVSNWKRGEKTPPIERALELAEYADLCVQFLYKGQGPRRPWGDMSRPLAKLVTVWEDLSATDRDKLLEYAELLRMRQSAPDIAASQNVTLIRKTLPKTPP